MVRDSFGSRHGQFQAQACKNKRPETDCCCAEAGCRKCPTLIRNPRQRNPKTMGTHLCGSRLRHSLHGYDMSNDMPVVAPQSQFG